MSVACLVLTHRAPEQVCRLARRLAPNPVYLHVDRNVPAAVVAGFARVAELDHVHTLPRLPTAWASWNLVTVMVEGLRAALRDATSAWHHAVLMTGQDYPLRSGEGLAEWLSGYEGVSFVQRRPTPDHILGRRESRRRTRYVNTTVRGQRIPIPAWRRWPPGVPPWVGPMQWVLSRPHAETVVRIYDERPDLMRYLRGCWIPDEIFMSTVVANFVDPREAVDECLTLFRWSVRRAAHPDVLTSADLPILAEAATGPTDVGGPSRLKLIARKFDAAADPSVLDAIDSAADTGWSGVAAPAP